MAESLQTVPIDQITPSDYNPRSLFEADELGDLAASIKRHGLMEPLVIRPAFEAEGYEIIAGERRYRASKIAGLKALPCRIMEVDRSTAMQLAIVENLQRRDLNPMEEADGYDRLRSECHLKPKQIATAVGRSLDSVNATLRLLNLPPHLQERIRSGEWTQSDGLALHHLVKYPAVLDHIVKKLDHRDQYSSPVRPSRAPSYMLRPSYDAMQDGVVRQIQRDLVDISKCKDCSKDVHESGYCYSPATYDRLLKIAQENNAKQLKELSTKAGVQLMDVSMIGGNSERLDYQPIPTGCSEACVCRASAVAGGKIIPVCTDRAQFAKLRMKQTKAENKAKRQRGQKLMDEIGPYIDRSTDTHAHLVAICERALRRIDRHKAAKEALRHTPYPADKSFFIAYQNKESMTTRLAALSDEQLLKFTLEALLRDEVDSHFNGTSATFHAPLTQWLLEGIEVEGSHHFSVGGSDETAQPVRDDDGHPQGEATDVPAVSQTSAA